MKKKSKYYDIRTMMQAYPDAKYYMAIGERSNGKTYSALDYVLDNYFEKGEQFADLAILIRILCRICANAATENAFPACNPNAFRILSECFSGIKKSPQPRRTGRFKILSPFLG